MSDTSLTGAYDTGRISKIAGEPVTITVSRTPTVGRELEFERWTEHAARVLDDFPGSLGVGILRPGEPGGEWHIVFRFVDGLSLRVGGRGMAEGAGERAGAGQGDGTGISAAAMPKGTRKGLAAP